MGTGRFNAMRAAQPDLVGFVDTTAPHRFAPELLYGLYPLHGEACLPQPIADIAGVEAYVIVLPEGADTVLWSADCRVFVSTVPR